MITVEHLTKCYGDFTAVSDLSFEIGKGHVYGFLGPNGAGKSTTMNIMTGCLSATSGRVLIGGHDIYEEPEEAKKLIGYLPEQPPLYQTDTPLEYLTFVGQARGLKGSELKKQIQEVISQTGLDNMKNRLISALSKGYRQRVGIASALLGNPEVIILDEPTVGLDPIQIIEIRDLIRKLGETHTVIFSSHILSEVQAICEKVLIISHGHLAAFDTPEHLETLMSRSSGVYFRVLAGKEETEEVLRDLSQAENCEIEVQDDGSCSVHVTSSDPDTRDLCCRLFFAFAGENLPIFEMTSRRANLEDVFLELTDDRAADSDSDEYADDDAELPDPEPDMKDPEKAPENDEKEAETL